MVLAQMIHQSIVGMEGRLSQTFQLFPRQHKVVCAQPSNVAEQSYRD
jgi:hypothetical protein